MAIQGFINLLKPPCLSSHGAVGEIRALLGTRAVGHAGTLDPAASGVLPLGIGRATRLLEYLLESDKVYLAEITFGLTTDTLDQEGQIVWRAARPPLLPEQRLKEILSAFIGRQEQIPPAFAAIKHKGKPLYTYAREGHAVEVPPRPVTIYGLEPLTFSAAPWPTLLLRIKCSKGTYIRSLARDLGRAMGTEACLTFLLREEVGAFSLREAFTLEEVAKLQAAGKKKVFLLPAATALENWPQVDLDFDLADRFCKGQRLRIGGDGGLNAVYYEDLLLGIGMIKKGVLFPRKVLVQQEELGR